MGIHITHLRLQYVFSVMLQAQLSGLAPLVVPKRLLHRGRGEKGDGEGESGEFNQTDLEKTLAKDTANLLRVGGGSEKTINVCVCLSVCLGAERHGSPSSY